jgi:hypothetical protein
MMLASCATGITFAEGTDAIATFCSASPCEDTEATCVAPGPPGTPCSCGTTIHVSVAAAATQRQQTARNRLSGWREQMRLAFEARSESAQERVASRRTDRQIVGTQCVADQVIAGPCGAIFAVQLGHKLVHIQMLFTEQLAVDKS